MKNANSFIVFSAALVLGAAVIGGTLLYAGKSSTAQGSDTTLKDKIPLISVDGIFTARDAYRRIRMGASLVQMLTGWIYEGPMVLKRINKELAQLLGKDGFKTVEEAVGSGVH